MNALATPQCTLFAPSVPRQRLGRPGAAILWRPSGLGAGSVGRHGSDVTARVFDQGRHTCCWLCAPEMLTSMLLNGCKPEQQAVPRLQGGALAGATGHEVHTFPVSLRLQGPRRY